MSDRRALPLVLVLALVLVLVLYLLRPDEISHPTSTSTSTVVDPTVAVVESAATPSPPAAGAAGAWSRDVPGDVLLDDAPWVGTLLWTRVDTDLRPLETLRVATDAQGRFVARVGRGAWLVSLDTTLSALSFWMEDHWEDRVLALVAASEDDEFPDTWGEVATEWLPPDREQLLLRARSPQVFLGQVVDDVTGRPITDASARLVCAEAEVALAEGDATGAFRLPVPTHAREASLFVRAAGYGMSAIEWQLGDHDALPSAGLAVVFRLRPALRLRGRVVDDQGLVVPGAWVSLSAFVDGPLGGWGRDVHCTWEGSTDAAGRFVIDGIAERADPGGDDAATDGLGPYGSQVTLECSAEGFDSAQLLDVPVGPDAPTVEVRLTRPQRLVGRVVGPDGPLAGAHVTVLDQAQVRHLADVGFIGHRATHRYPRGDGSRYDEVPTDPAGAFVIPNTAGQVWIIAEAAWMAPRVVEVKGPVDDLTIRLDAAAPPIEGRVIVDGGAPLAGVTVTAYLAGRSEAPPPSPTFRLTTPGVRDADLREVGVRVVGATVTGGDGTFRLDGLPDAILDLAVWNPARADMTLLHDVVPGSAGGTGIVIRSGRRPASDLTLTLTTPDGRPPEDVRVSVFREDRSAAESWTFLSPSAPDAVPFEWGERLYVLDEPLLVQVVARDRRPEVLRLVARVGQPMALGPIALTQAGGEVALRVRWARRPAPALTASWVDPGTGLPVTTRVRWLADPAALVSLGRAAPGALDVVLRRDDDVVVARYAVTTRAGETTVLDLDLTGP